MGSSKPNLMAMEKAKLKTYADNIEQYYTPFLFSNTIIRLKKATKMTIRELSQNTNINSHKIRRILRKGDKNISVTIAPMDVCNLACAFGLNEEDFDNLLKIAFPEIIIVKKYLGKSGAASDFQNFLNNY